MPQRALNRHLELSGVSEHNKKHYADRNKSVGLIVPEDTVFEPPKNYTKEAKEVWKITIKGLMLMTELGFQDLAFLRGVIDTYDDYIRLRKRYQKFEKSHKNDFDEKTILQQKALFTTMNNARETFNKAASKLGLTPTDRSRLPIRTTKEPKEIDPLAVILED